MLQSGHNWRPKSMGLRAKVNGFAKHVGKDVLIKAAGGISSINDAEKFISLGANRLGTSRIVKEVKNKNM